MRVDFEKVDERGKEHHQETKYLPITEDFLLDSPAKVSLRDYQVEAAMMAIKERRGIIQCATGGGKTVIFGAIVKALDNNYQTVILMRNRSLVDQTFNAFTSFGVANVGRISGDYFEPNKITIGTIQSLHKFPQIEKAKALIIDEVHEFTSKKSSRDLRAFKNTIFRLGFSATPWKDNDPIHNMTLKSWIGPQLAEVDVSYLQDRGVLSPAVVQFHHVDRPKIPDSATWAEAEELGIAANTTFHKRVAALVNSIPEGRLMIMVRKLKHGDALQELIPDSHWIRGEDTIESREFVLSQLRKSNQRKVVAIVSSIGYVGVNVFVHHLVNASGGKSAIQLVQKFGRGLRLAEDKAQLHYHDFIFSNNRYLFSHSKQRVDILRNQGHEVIVPAEFKQ